MFILTGRKGIHKKKKNGQLDRRNPILEAKNTITNLTEVKQFQRKKILNLYEKFKNVLLTRRKAVLEMNNKT